MLASAKLHFRDSIRRGVLVLGDVIVSAIYSVRPLHSRRRNVRLGNSGRIDGGFARVTLGRL